MPGYGEQSSLVVGVFAGAIRAFGGVTSVFQSDTYYCNELPIIAGDWVRDDR